MNITRACLFDCPFAETDWNGDVSASYTLCVVTINAMILEFVTTGCLVKLHISFEAFIEVVIDFKSNGLVLDLHGVNFVHHDATAV